MTQMNFELIHRVLSVTVMITGRHLWWTCPLYVQSLLRGRRTHGRRSWISDIMVWLRHLLVQASSRTPQAFSLFPVQIFILSPLWPTLAKCHTFHFLLLSLIPLRVYVQIETADKNLRMETHLLCGAHPQLCQTATSQNRQQFQLFKVCVWPSRSISANDACADRGRSD